MQGFGNRWDYPYYKHPDQVIYLVKKTVSVAVIFLMSMTVCSQPYVVTHLGSLKGSYPLTLTGMSLLPEGRMVAGGKVSGENLPGSSSVFFTLLEPAGQEIQTWFTGGPGYTYLPCFTTDSAGKIHGILIYRDTLMLGDSLFVSHQRSGVLCFSMKPGEQPENIHPLLTGFKGAVYSCVIDKEGVLWIGGWFRNMVLNNIRYRSIGKGDGFVLRISPQAELRLIRFTGAGMEEIRTLDMWEGKIVAAGSFTREIVTGNSRVKVPSGMMCFAATLADHGDGISMTGVFRAKEITLHDNLLMSGGRWLMSGSAEGAISFEDTMINPGSGRKGFLLTTDTLFRPVILTSLEGEGENQVTQVSRDHRGRLFALAGFKETLMTDWDTLTARDRYTDGCVTGIDTATLQVKWMRQISGAGEQDLYALITDDKNDLHVAGLSSGPCNIMDQQINNSGSGIFLITLADPCKQVSSGLPDTAYFCKGGSVTLEAGEGSDYYWSPGASANRYVNVTDTGMVQLVMTDPNGCRIKDSVRVLKDSVVLSFTVTDEVTPPGNNGSIVMQITGGYPPYRVLWENGMSANSRASLTAGNYAVEVTDAKECHAEADVEVGQQVASGIYDLTVSPNPFNDMTRIYYNLPENVRVDVSLYDMSGRRIICFFSENREKGSHSFEFHREALLDGVYYLRISSPLGSVSRKMIITHDDR